MPINKAFGEAMVVARLQMSVNARRYIRAQDMAKKLGVSQSYMCGLELGKKIPSLEMLAKIIRVYPPGCGAEIRASLKLESERYVCQPKEK